MITTGRLGGIVLALLASAATLPAQEVLPHRATVYRDAYGVPHVFGPTDEAVAFGAAWVQAEEDWPMVEQNFARASGRGAELLGESALSDDYVARALEIPRLSREEYARSSPRMRALLDAYAAGFNAYLEAHPEARGFLDRVEPWHTLALIRFKYHQLEFLAYAGFREANLERLLEEGGPGGEPPVAPAAGFGNLGSGSVMRYAETLTGPLGDIPLGSNEWALGPSRTANGTTMLLVNPHQSFFGVERYLEIHLHSDEGLVFSGLTRFGFLLPYMGNNPRLGWTYTDNYADISDLYLERFDDPARPLSYRYGDGRLTAETWTETAKVKVEGSTEERTLTFWKTRHGPIVGRDGDGIPMAARIAQLAEGGWFAQLDAMIRARTLDEFQEAVAPLSIAYMNLMYADADGNIWYLYGSAVPARDPAFDWRRPVDGSDPRTEWGPYHPLRELPQVLNPASGWLLNTNSSPLAATDRAPFTREDFPPYMIGSETNNVRAVSSRRVLEGLEAATLDEFADAVLDTRLSLADSLVPVLVREWEALEGAAGAVPEALTPGSPGRAAIGPAVERLRDWDRRAAIESVETTWFVLAIERWFLDRHAGPGPFRHLEALAKTLAGLEEIWGRTEVAWGEVNRLQRPPSQDPDDFAAELPSVPVAGAPGAFGSVFVFHADPRGSTGVRYGVHGNSFVKVIEFGPRARGRSVLVFGQSGDPESPHFFDQARHYSAREFKPAWFTRAEVEANAARSYPLPVFAPRVTAER